MELLQTKQQTRRQTALRWLTAGVLAAVCMLLTFALYHATYLNNDDTNILYALAGYRTETPEITHRFINIALGALISGLYAVLPAVPWWTVYQLVMLWLSATVIGACLLKCTHRAGLPHWTGIAAFLLLYWTMLVYTVVWVAFTLTAAMLGAAAVALLLTSDFGQETRLTGWVNATGCLLLVLLCFFTRNSSGYSMMCFFGAALLYRFLCARGTRRLRVALLAAAVCLTAAGAVTLNNYGIRAANPAEYPAFEQARGEFIDYPHITYSEDPAFFERIGWDQSIYDLADNLCYLDERVNAQTMTLVAQTPGSEATGLGSRLKNAVAYGITYFRTSGVSQYMLVVPVLLTLALAVLFFRGGRRAGKELFIGLATAAGAFLLCFYLCFAGRFPVRTFMLIAIPAALTELLLCCKTAVSGAGQRQPKKSHRMRNILLLAAAGICLLWSLAMTQKALLVYDKTDRIAENAAAEAYVIAHPENIYITDVTSVENIALFTVYPDSQKRPVNLIDWGGTAMYSGWKEKQLAVNGLEKLSPDLFRQQNCYFLTADSNNKLEILDAYLQRHAGATGYELVDRITKDLSVYRFVFPGEGE